MAEAAAALPAGMAVAAASPLPPPKMKNNAAGFTIFECAIVVLVTGLLFSGLLRANELVNAARTRVLAGDLHTVRTAFHAYRDRFHALPGDHLLVVDALPGAAAATTPGGETGNGRIDGLWDSLITTDESYLLWQHLRLAGYVAGVIDPAAPDYPPRNSIGTRVGISSRMQIRRPTAMSGSHSTCMADVPGELARRLDVYMDDGDTAAGSLRISAAASPDEALPTAAVTDGGKYIVCLSL